ncbi:MarR family winged helix-turn-helix transcriptional regulator [Paenibacillus crassostreae]|uniref:MarR family transcriptional regulator n=1 Tax=Paenibacillus crassostreae TaxID=1763538 RepID=A0A167FBI5_9BACL|nr:MarR family transcriptional regulator [Paenibacillus crassostreae]AOZ90854.1 MarR family transcriptional regulator [Paenibacillus crassostreae]OAB76380.1 MarR family transcriptional regulator [Paenibacillus crassostreae]
MADHEDFYEISSLFTNIIKGITQDWNKQGHELSITHCKTLYRLSKDGPQKVSQLACSLNFTSAAITGITDHLFTEGYVNKERAENDRRVVNITITKKGEEMVQGLKENQRELVGSYFKTLPDEDVEHLKRIFTTLISGNR